MNVTRDGRKGRGRGNSRGGGGTKARGRGRGRSFAPKALQVFDVDGSDDVCNVAFEQFELQNNSLSKSFEALNAATELPGFDPSLGSIWIYPTNRSVRDYQFNIVQTALFHNTLVSLPTGLGKTFISAVVMYNFQRWYPRGLVVFMAPTRPLVTQQLDACHNTVGISPTKTIELTGHINPIKREKLWQEKTVFFLTPQVLLSDLERGYFRAEDLRLIVVDEAHKATGNHAYAQVISKVSESSRLFRVLALSATPGSDLDAVQQVFRNLLISRIELRTETSLDVLPYIHDKAVEKKVVNLGNSYLKSTYDQIVTVFQTYSGKLLKAGALTGRDGYSYTHFQLLTARETFRKGLALKLPSYQKGFIENDFAICMSLAHAMEILLSHGLRTFFIYLQGVLNKEKGSAMVTAELKKNTQLQVLLDEIKEKLNISVANSTFEMDLTNKPGIFDEVSFSETRRNMGKDIDYTLSHPKLAILKDIVSNHFLAYAAKNESTRVMIFSQYRDSVQEIGNMLNSLRPMVKPIVFIGQSSTGTTGKGLKQKDQVQVVQQFREGGFNVLVSTCVGEEGLDIGEVDLIVCFDASSSPTRLMQRMGRTGRQREGKAIFLVTQGKEEEKYRRSFNQHSSISKSITDPQRLEPYLYKFSPRMVPVGIEPTCFKMSIVLSTEMNGVPEIVLTDDDNDENLAQNKEKTKKDAKKPTVRKKKQKDKSGAVQQPLNTIKTMFEQVADKVSQREIAEAVEAPEPLVEFMDADYDQGAFDCADEMQVYLPSQPHAYQRDSIFISIFDMEPKRRAEWKECTSWSKSAVVLVDDIMDVVSVDPESIALTECELAEVDFNLASRNSFASKPSAYCECGNLLEQQCPPGVCNIRSSTPINQPAIHRSQPQSMSQRESPDAAISLHQLQAAPAGCLNDENPSPPFSDGFDQLLTKLVEKPWCSDSNVIEKSLQEFPPSPPGSIDFEQMNHFDPKPQRSAHEQSFKESLNRGSESIFEMLSSSESSDEDCFNKTPSPPQSTSPDEFFNEFPPSPDSNKRGFLRRLLDQKMRKAGSIIMEPKRTLQKDRGFPKNDVPVKVVKPPVPQQTTMQHHFNTKETGELDIPKTSKAPKKFTFKKKPTQSASAEVINENVAQPRIPQLPDIESRSPFHKLPESKNHTLTAREFHHAQAPKPTSNVLSNVLYPSLESPFSNAYHNNQKVRKNEERPRLATGIKSQGDIPKCLSSKAAMKSPENLFRHRSQVLQLRIQNSSFIDEEETMENNTNFTAQEDFYISRTVPAASSTIHGISPIRRVAPKVPQTIFKSPHAPAARPSRFPSFNTSNVSSALNSTSSSSKSVLSFVDRSPPKNRNRRKSNPFIDSEAEESGDESDRSHYDDMDDFEGLDDVDDSFVTHDESFGVTDSQQVRYLESVKDSVPVKFGRVETPLSPKATGGVGDESGESCYEEDSICQDEVEFVDVGVFTQAMHAAKVDLALNGSSQGRQTRRAKRQAALNAAAPQKTTKQRRRIVVMDDSSDEDY